MKIKPPFVPWLLVAILLVFSAGLFASPDLQRQKNQPQPQKGTPIYIPNEVKTVMLQGMPERQARLDIPFTVTHNIFLPAQSGFHTVFFLKIKNAELDYHPAVAEKKEAKNESNPQETQAQPSSESQLQATFNVFLMFNILEAGQTKTLREVYIPCNIMVPQGALDPEKEDYYTFGYPLAAGNYLLAVAITSLDLKKIGLQYYEFSLPDPASFTDTMETTPIFFVKSMERIDAPEMRPTLHKDYFTYSVLKIFPNVERIFAVGENLDIFFFILGAQPAAEQKYNIETNYEVKQNDELAIRWAPGTYDSPLISQPLPLQQTVIIKKGEEQRQETRDLPAGKYVLGIQIQDKVSGKTLSKTVDFEVR